MTDEQIEQLIAEWREWASALKQGIYTRNEVAQAFKICADALEDALTLSRPPPSCDCDQPDWDVETHAPDCNYRKPPGAAAG
jgi:hypothetical protein